MSQAKTTTPCALRLTPDDLSAWRDHALSPAETARITEHLHGCPACRRIAAADESLAAALLADQPPASDPRNWSNLQARITGAASARISASAHGVKSYPPRAAIWSGIGAIAAVLLISALFFQLFGQQALLRQGKTAHKTTSTGTPGPLVLIPPTAPVKGQPLVWQSRSVPASVVPPPGNESMTNSIAYAPSDARTAYICSAANTAGSNPIAIWATHDGANTWTHTADLPNTGSVAQCTLTVDALNAQRLNLFISGQDTQTLKDLLLSYISNDGGQTWTPLNSKITQLLSVSSAHGVSVALVGGVLPYLYTPQAKHATLAISTDDFRTLRSIDSQFTNQGQYVSRVWQRPSDGALLAEVETMRPVEQSTQVASPTANGVVGQATIDTYQLWQSGDLGFHWTPFPTPEVVGNVSTGFSPYFVAQPSGSEQWKVCGYVSSSSYLPNDPSAAQPAYLSLGCTSDGGATWIGRSMPDLKISCSGLCTMEQSFDPSQSWLLRDGSLVSVFSATLNPQTLSDYHLFRLAPGATHWQDIGSMPGNALILAGSPSGAALVSFSGGSSVNGYGGSIVGQMGGNVPNRGVLFYAALP